MLISCNPADDHSYNTHEIKKTGYEVNAVNDIERYLSYQMNHEKHLEIIMRIYENFMLHTWIQ